MKLQLNNKVHQLSLDYARISDVIFLAEAEQEGFSDVEIVTSASHRKDIATQIAFDAGATILNIDTRIEQLELSLPLEQFIEIFDNKVLVVMNVPEINDYVVNTAMLMLMQVPEFIPGKRMLFDGATNKEYTYLESRGNPNA